MNIDSIILDMAVAAYNKFNKNLIGCCEEHWNDMPEDFRIRMCDAQKEALKAGIKSFSSNLVDMIE